MDENKFNDTAEPSLDHPMTGPEDTAFEIPEKKKKSALPLVAAGLAAACVGITAAVTRVASPETNVKNEISRCVEDYSSRETIKSLIFDEGLEDVLVSGDYTTEGNIQLSENSASEKANGLGVSFSNVVASSEKKISSDINLRYNGADLVRVMMTMDENTTRVHVPKLFNESFSVENQNVLTQLSKSPVFSKYAQEAMKETGDFSIMPFAGIDTSSAAYALKDKVKEYGIAALKEADSNLTYEKGNKTTAPDGTQADIYIVTLPASAAKQALGGFLTNVRNSEEYTNTLNSAADYAFSSKPDTAAQYGDKESLIQEFNSEFDKLIQSVNDAETEDIKINVIPLKDGIVFGVDQPVAGVNVKIDGEYNCEANVLKINSAFVKDEKEFKFDYDDSINTVEGVVSENRAFSVSGDGTVSVFTINSDYDKNDSSLRTNAEISNGEQAVKFNFEGTAQRSDKKLEVKADKLSVDSGEVSFVFDGNYTFRERTEEPREINSSAEYKVSEIGIMQALGLYNEAKENLGSIADMLGLD